jgi:hypothetical protein
MLINVTINGDKVILQDLGHLADELPHAIDRGLIRSAKGTHREAFAWLSGPGSKSSVKKSIAGSQAGSYPVPVRTAHLRGRLDWLKPGTTKSGEAGTFTAGQHEVVIYDSAIYALPIFEGKGSSAKFGPRDALKDGFEKFNTGGGVVRAIDEEIKKEIKTRRLS